MGATHAFGPLSETVEERLERRLAAGDRGARRRLIESYLGLVAAMARRYARWGVPLEDLFQEGALALVQGIDHYDPSKGMRLSTYVTWWVKQAIRRAAMAQSMLVRIPERLWERAGEAAQAGRTLRCRSGREARDSDVAGALGWSEEDLAEVRRALQPVVSLEAPVGDEGFEWGELIADPGADDPAEVAARDDARRRLAEALAALPERGATVLSRRYGLDGRPRSLAAVGETLGVSRERVRQLENAALSELRERRRELGLEGLAA
jgi:RNA polymerase primary sigma factor